MADKTQMHLRIDESVKNDFHAWCAKRGASMSEVCRLMIEALLNEGVYVRDPSRIGGIRAILEPPREPRYKETTDDRQSVDKS
jgi:hypothetical protein